MKLENFCHLLTSQPSSVVVQCIIHASVARLLQTNLLCCLPVMQKYSKCKCGQYPKPGKGNKQLCYQSMYLLSYNLRCYLDYTLSTYKRSLLGNVLCYADSGLMPLAFAVPLDCIVCSYLHSLQACSPQARGCTVQTRCVIAHHRQLV